MSKGHAFARMRSLQLAIYLGVGVSLAILSILFLIWSVGYMERAYVGTSLISALIGFTLLSASLYVLRLSAYVYVIEKEGPHEK